MNKFGGELNKEDTSKEDTSKLTCRAHVSFHVEGPEAGSYDYIGHLRDSYPNLKITSANVGINYIEKK